VAARPTGRRCRGTPCGRACRKVRSAARARRGCHVDDQAPGLAYVGRGRLDQLGQAGLGEDRLTARASPKQARR
jgi:hypothetical protein